MARACTQVAIPAVIARCSPSPELLLLIVIYWVFRRITRGVATGFRLGQLDRARSWHSTHEANDAQKTMGVIALALFANGNLNEFEIQRG